MRDKALVEKELGCLIQCLGANKGGEFSSIEVNDTCSMQGVKTQLITAYNSQQIGLSKRKNRIFMDIVRNLLA